MKKQSILQHGASPVGLRPLAGLGLALVVAAASWQLPAFADEVSDKASTLCVACHGTDGVPNAPEVPSIAGQHQDYLTKQLRDFLAGRRKSETKSAVLAEAKPPELAGLAAYFAPQKPAAGKVQDASLLAEGKKLFEGGNAENGLPACDGCHSAGGVGSAKYPRLTGQNPAYVIKELTHFKTGERANDHGKMMRSVASRMSEREINAVAQYIASLK